MTKNYLIDCYFENWMEIEKLKITLEAPKDIEIKQHFKYQYKHYIYGL